MVTLSSLGALAWLLAALSPPSPVEIGAEVRHDVGPLVVADGRFVVAGPVDVPEAARASADASTADGHASSHAILALVRERSRVIERAASRHRAV